MQIADRSAADYFLPNTSVVNPDRSVYLWAGAYTSFAGDQPAVRYTSTALGFRKEYPITDHLGSVRVVLTPDERQSIVSRSDFEPFGAPLANGRERLSFIGKEQDNESSLGDYGVRKYDPTLGRFMSVDALSDLMPGSSPFHYCFNNPLILRDPSGLVPGDIGSDGIPRFTTGEVVCEADGPWHHWWSNIEGVRRGNEWMNGQGASRMGNPTAADRVAMGAKEEAGSTSAEFWTKANTVIGAVDVSNGLKAEMISLASKSAPAVNQLRYVRGVRLLGHGTFAASGFISSGLAYYYYSNGGTDASIAIKAGLDILMSAAAYAGPVGLGISATYFIVDAAGIFGDFGNPLPTTIEKGKR